MLRRSASAFYIVTIVAMTAVAVYSATTDYKINDTPTAVFGGQLVVSQISDPKTFNPVFASGVDVDVISPIFEGLTIVDGVTGNVLPHLATSWTYSESGLIWNLRIRKGVLFSDGVEMTADDVMFSFDVVLDSTLGSPYRNMLMVDGQPVRYNKVNDYEIEVTTPSPFAPLLRNLSYVKIIPKHKLEAAWRSGGFKEVFSVNATLNTKEIIGTGMYTIATYKPKEYIVYTRTSNYWVRTAKGQSLPYITRFVRMIVPNREAELLKFKAGETSIITVKSSDYKTLKDLQSKENFTLFDLGPTHSVNFIAFNQNSKNPDFQSGKKPWKLEWFRNEYFRKGIAHLVDKVSIIDRVYNGLAVPLWGPLTAASKPYFSNEVLKYEYSLESAKEMFKKAGFKYIGGKLVDNSWRQVEFTLLVSFDSAEGKSTANILSESLKKAGIDVVVEILPFSQITERIMSSYKYDAVLIALSGGQDPHASVNVWQSDGSMHFWNPNQETPATEWEAEINEIFKQGVGELDLAKRVSLYNRWQTIVSDKLPMIFTVTPISFIAIRNNLKNVSPSVFGGALHNLLELYIQKP